MSEAETLKRGLARPTMRTLVRPVSQVALVLSDQAAFGTAIRESILWMNSNNRCAGAIPRKALDGEPFDLTHTVGAMPAAALFLEEPSRRLWAGKLDFPDRNVGQRTWSTEISIAEIGPKTYFSARLTNITRGPNPGYSPSVPGIVRQIVSKLSAEADEYPITDDVQRIDARTHGDFEYLLHSKARRLPILAFSENDSGQTLLDPQLALNRVVGTAHVVRIDPEISWQLTRSLGQAYSVFGGAARIFWPGFDPDNDDPFRHPLQRRSPRFDIDDYLAWLAGRVLPRAFVGVDADGDLVRFTDAQAQLSRQRRTALEQGTRPADNSALLESLQLSLEAVEKQRIEDAEAAQALLDEASETIQESEQIRESLIEEVARLRARLLSLPSAPAAGPPEPARRLHDYDDLPQWSEEVLGNHIEILPRALREAAKSGVPEMLEKLEATLLLIRDHYVPMRLESKEGQRDAYLRRCEEVGVEESGCFANKNDIKNFPEYKAIYHGDKIYLDRHFKFGTGYDLRRMFRIYFTWDEDTAVCVIGHLPTHLDNNNTQ